MTSADLTRDRILSSAIHQMATQLDRVRHRRVVPAVEIEKSRRERAKEIVIKTVREIRIVGDFVPERKPSHAVIVPPPINRGRANEAAQQYLRKQPTEPDEDGFAATVVAICGAWGKPDASRVAAAWVGGTDTELESHMDGDGTRIAILVGIAAAAALIAVVFLVRRGRSVPIPGGHELAPSADFRTLRAVAAGEGAAAEVAAAIRDSVAEPWRWTLQMGLSQLPPDEKRSLLEAFANSAGGGIVTRFIPAKGDAFDTMRMVTDVHTDTGDQWVVCAEVAADRVGYELHGRVEIPATVAVSTVDWWILSSTDCPVGRAIVERSDELVPGGATGSSRWRASWGLAHPEDLRELFDELSLDIWRKRMVTELNPHYRGHSDRCLEIVGAAGDPFESSTMESAGADPLGDAVVEEVVDRQGKPQSGLACPGGSPLLFAIVRTTAVRRGRS